MTTKLSRRDHLAVHPAADLFPMMSKDELKVLGEDIKKNGLQQRVEIWVGNMCGSNQLLDGRNRLDAMEFVGLKVLDDDDDGHIFNSDLVNPHYIYPGRQIAASCGTLTPT